MLTSIPISLSSFNVHRDYCGKSSLNVSLVLPLLQLSPTIINGLHNIARSIETRNYSEGLAIHTHIVSTSNFSETSAFMPVLKVVLTQANKLGVWRDNFISPPILPFFPKKRVLEKLYDMDQSSLACFHSNQWRAVPWFLQLYSLYTAQNPSASFCCNFLLHILIFLFCK